MNSRYATQQQMTDAGKIRSSVLCPVVADLGAAAVSRTRTS